jgi:hypothetical protein
MLLKFATNSKPQLRRIDGSKIQEYPIRNNALSLLLNNLGPVISTKMINIGLLI